MSRIDLARLRKRAGMSQRELAGHLQVRPSFLSAIENGRSRLPEEKIDRLKEIFELDDFSDYMTDDVREQVVPPHTHPHTHIGDEGDSLTMLLTHIHDLAHQRDRHSSDADGESAERIDFLERRNDRLSQRIDDLREETDRLRIEILRLKELLIRNGIEY